MASSTPQITSTYADYPSRRPARMLPHDDCLRLLQEGDWGVLSLSGEHGPYGVPLNYAARITEHGVTLVFHGALQGLKLDIIARSPEACFTVVLGAKSLPAVLNTRYESVMAFGAMRCLEGEEKDRALRFFGEHFCADFPREMEKELAATGHRAAVFCMEVTSMTGKFNKGA